MALTQHNLRRWFREFNARYFGGSIPANTVVRFEQLEGKLGYCNYDGVFRIHINRNAKLLGSSARFTLLHEMAHIATWHARSDHGAEFEAEMQRLAAAGAMRGLW